MTNEEFRALALSFPGTIENPHFERAAFKVEGKRIFATLLESNATANIKFQPSEQAVFCAFDPAVIYPLPNKWGLSGWTTFVLKSLPYELLFDALNTAYQDVLKPSKKRSTK